MAGPGPGITGAPLRRAAEVPVHDEAVVLLPLLELDPLALDVVAVPAGAHAGPGDAVVGELAHRDRRLLHEDPRDLLVRAPIRAPDRVQVMHVRIVPLALDAVGERGLHASLCSAAVAAARRHQRQD